MKFKKNIFFLHGYGGGEVLIHKDEIAGAYDVRDSSSGTFCCVLLKHSNTSLRVMHSAKEIWNKLTVDLETVGDDDGRVQSRTT